MNDRLFADCEERKKEVIKPEHFRSPLERLGYHLPCQTLPLFLLA